MSGGYRTKPRERLFSFLSAHPGQHCTALEIEAYFRQNDDPISLATIYRQLDRMVAEGLVVRYAAEPGESACFEYIGPHTEGEGESCFHTRCEVCGKMIHLHCDELTQIQQHILQEHDFQLDPRRTTLYGVCGDCQERADQH